MKVCDFCAKPTTVKETTLSISRQGIPPEETNDVVKLITVELCKACHERVVSNVGLPQIIGLLGGLSTLVFRIQELK